MGRTEYVRAVPVYDPEIVCVQPSARYEADQLGRFAACALPNGVMIGKMTHQAMCESIARYCQDWPSGARFSFSDFIKIAEVYSRAPVLGAGGFDCSAVVAHRGYRPYYGDGANGDVLAADLRDIAHEGIVLVSDRRCWDLADCDGLDLGEDVWLAGFSAGCDMAHEVGACEMNRCRSTIRNHPEDEGVLAELAESAFPDLVFSDSLFSGLGKLKRSYRENVEIIVRHLAVLNDHACGIWAECPDSRERSRRMGALGVVCSGELGSTMADKKAVRERTALFDGQPKVCEWHTKLHGHTDRIHFCIEDGAVYVGLFAAHCK